MDRKKSYACMAPHMPIEDLSLLLSEPCDLADNV